MRLIFYEIKLLLTKLLCNFIEVALRHGCFPVNLLHFFRTSFPKNTSGRLLFHYVYVQSKSSLRKIQKFHAVFWCGNFLEIHSLHRVSANRTNVCTPRNWVNLLCLINCSKIPQFKILLTIYDFISR